MCVCCDIKASANKTILFRIDNSGSCRVLRKGYSTKDQFSSTIARAIYFVASAVNCRVFARHVRRRSTKGAEMADDISKGLYYRPVMDLIGEQAVLDGFKFPRLPKSLISWIQHPEIDDNLDVKILSEISKQEHPPLIMGYNLV